MNTARHTRTAAVIATTPLAIDMYLPAMPQLAQSLQTPEAHAKLP